MTGRLETWCSERSPASRKSNFNEKFCQSNLEMSSGGVHNVKQGLTLAHAWLECALSVRGLSQDLELFMLP